MNRRALIFALVIALLGTVLLVLYTKKFEREASGGDKVNLLIALKPIERNKQITEDMLGTHPVPQAYVEDRAIREVDKSKILGLKVGTTIQAQQTLMWTDLVTANEERRDLSSLIVPGNRAVSVKTRREDANAAMVKPGDYIDLIAVLPDPQSQDHKIAMVLLQKVLVLAAGLQTSPENIDPTKDGRPPEESMLTLSMRLDQVQLLNVASERGYITLALRSPNDNRTGDQVTVSSSSLVKPAEIKQYQEKKLPQIIEGHQ